MTPRPFYKTSEFWLTVLMNVLTCVMAIAGSLPTKYSVPILAVTNGFYAIARGLAKSGGGNDHAGT